MKQLIVLFFMMIAGFAVVAQKASVKGSVRDTAENKNLTYAVISVLSKSDSALIKFTRSDKDGLFVLNNLPAGKYFVVITYPKFADFVDEVSVRTDQEINMGLVMMTPKRLLLQEVVVRHNLSIRMKGDTIEYKSDSFHVQEGANVQDLLKKMPGIQVDRNGQITAQGQKVEKLLVDGEEFFSDDPAVVTQNLRADAVDKVQSYNKKSDQAEFTGVDDGTRTKTLNLVLKNDKKKGYFGKLSAGAGTDDRYDNQAMLNYFKGKKKASVYGVMSNTGRLGLGWEDRDKFGGGEDWGDNLESGAGFIMFSGDNNTSEFNDHDYSFEGEGIPLSWKAGAHFSNKWNRDISHVNNNYSIRQIINDAEGSSLTRYILPDSAYYFRETHRNYSTQMRQLFTGFYDMKLDSQSSIRIRFNGSTGRTKNQQFTSSGSDNEDLQPVNRNQRDNKNTTGQQAFFGSILWKQRLKKKGRTFSLLASHKYIDREMTGFLLSLTDFYDTNGQIFDRDSIDQYKEYFNRAQATNAKVVYTEPFGKKSIIEMNYTLNRNITSSDRKSFDKVNGKYESLNSLFSNNYQLQYLSNSAGAKFQYNGKRLTANIGTNVGVSEYSQKDSLGKLLRYFRYVNLFPNARISYRIAAQSGINFSYVGTNQAPAIDQIQPISENTDPLNIIIGNPSLKQAFQNNLSMFYNNFKVLTGRSIWTHISYNFTNNAIVISQVTDSTGKRTQQYVNTNGNYNIFWYGSYGIKIKKINLNIDLHTRAGSNRYVSFVNNLKNTSNNRQVNFGVGLYKDKENKYSMYTNSDLSYNHSVSSISSSRNSFWTQNYDFGLNIYPRKRWEIGTDMNMDFRQKVDAFDENNDVITWNAFLTFKMFKKNNGLLKFSAYDMLNQRKGFDRSFTSNYVTERNYQVLQRYFMLSFTWNFSKSPGGDPAAAK